MGYSIGIGLTNACNLACAHCYRETAQIQFLTLDQVMLLCQFMPVEAVGMGTGENALHPRFAEIVSYLYERGIKLSIASNGYSLVSMPEETLRSFHDVEVSVDFPSQARQDALRGPGNWELVQRAMERCRRLGVEVSLLATLMRANYHLMGDMVTLARAWGANLRVNVYQPVRNESFMLAYDEFWEGFRLLFSEGLVISCSEPVVRSVMGLDEARSPCGRRSIRVSPRGQIVPCVYWPVEPDSGPHIEDLARLGEAVLDAPAFVAARHEPTRAAGCRCHGGCAARRALLGDLDAHDAYCPWARGEEVVLYWRPAPAKDLMRAGNVCTTLVM